ncbi:hypothetical protein [Desulfobulbus elongatus]|uniref:hypothetical protein n=1 Tax=Desulfobulbus elongatus TaxID=53332 RepID=UPI00048796C3|nr:hypothetical protein [Desulfobulbus elongatus]
MTTDPIATKYPSLFTLFGGLPVAEGAVGTCEHEQPQQRDDSPCESSGLEADLKELSEIMRQHPVRPYRSSDGLAVGIKYDLAWAWQHWDGVFARFCQLFWLHVDVICVRHWDTMQVIDRADAMDRVGPSGDFPAYGSTNPGARVSL